MPDPKQPQDQNSQPENTPQSSFSSEEVPVYQAPAPSAQKEIGLSPQIMNETLRVNEPIAITSSSVPLETPPPAAPHQPPGDGDKGLPKKKIGIIALAILVTLGIGVGAFLGVPKLFKKEEAKKDVELTWWGLWEEKSIVEPLIEEYQENHPGVTINYIKQSPQDYRLRLNSSLAKGAGSGPDIFRFHNTWVPMFKNELAPVPLDIMDSSAFSQNFYPFVRTDLASGGQPVGIPLMTDGLALYINERIFEENNVSIPVTWQDLRNAAVALTERGENGKIVQAGVSLGTVNNVDNWQDILSLMFLQNNADLNNPSDKKAEDALLFYTLFEKTDKVWDETLPSSTVAFSGGKLAMYIGPSWRVFEIKKLNPNLGFKIVPVPQLPKSTPDEKDVSWATYWVEGVWQGSTAKREALEFLKFLSGKEQLEAMYNNAAQIRLFGEIPSRRDMATARLEDPYIGAYLRQAETAKTWYLSGNTNDGETGINSRLSKYFEDAVNSAREGDNMEGILETLTQGVKQVLGSYGI